ncbi:AraC family transcriptional regulator [Compostibacter hankyongensis]|uniref:AraC family transcriptional regulator n=1 Tax=Compostibacter hankyongensis TaxID=1007089 RepID=A0ABP8FFK5_9BACT
MLKAAYEALPHTEDGALLVRRFSADGFRAPYHFHPELELTFIVNGRGKRYVGHSMEDYDRGDLVLLGANLPHCWKTTPAESNAEAGALVIQFAADFAGADFFSKATAAPVRELLQKSSGGIRFGGRARSVVAVRMKRLAGENSPFRQLIGLLDILDILAGSGEYTLLNPGERPTEQSPADRKRIGAVMAYLVENFRQPVSLGQAAAIAGMTPSAFCKYFKRATRRTFVETVTAYRLNYAAQQLAGTDKPVSAICYESGFGDVSHFNRMFRQRWQCSPLHYRKAFGGEETP